MSLRCWSVDTYNPCPGVIENVPSSNDYRGGFGTALMTKVCNYWKGKTLIHCLNERIDSACRVVKISSMMWSQDLGLAQDAATRTKAATPLGSVAHQVCSTREYVLFMGPKSNHCLVLSVRHSCYWDLVDVTLACDDLRNFSKSHKTSPCLTSCFQVWQPCCWHWNKT